MMGELRHTLDIRRMESMVGLTTLAILRVDSKVVHGGFKLTI